MSWLAEQTTLINALDALVELTIAVLIAWGVRARLGRVHPLAWLVSGYFLLRALVSINRALVDHVPEGTVTRATLLDLLSTFVVLVLLVNASRIVDALAFLVDEARIRGAEYERARRDYTQVVRHRINNPLTVIKGAAQTLDADIVDDETRRALRTAIIDAAETLERISLEPERQGIEERELDAVPRVTPE